MANILERIPYEKLNNTRDLGGMKTTDGKTIRKGLLIRSGRLNPASEADIAALGAMELVRIYDFRSAREQEEKPDPVIGKEINIHLPIMRKATVGITHEKNVISPLVSMILANSGGDPNYGKNLMKKTYLTFVQDEYAIGQFERFLKGVLAADGGVLWHCSGGKDRTGFAALLIETILGVSREDIMADYLATNDFLTGGVERIEKLHEMGIKIDAAVETGIRDTSHACSCYIDVLYEDVEAKYGSMEGFIREALHVDDNMWGQFREKYLY